MFWDIEKAGYSIFVQEMPPCSTLDVLLDLGTGAYQCRYFPTRLRHNPEHDLIGFAIGANWRVEDKVPLNLETLL
jgi:hypothetical protein